MKDAMRNDRARVQIGSISHFGLLEMSRQRLRLSINESISNLCPHCEGTGRIRSIDTAAIQVLRSIEDEAQKGEMNVLHITAHRDIALFILNHKRTSLADIESRFGLTIILHSDDSLIAPDYRVEREGFQGKSQTHQNHRQSKKTNHSNDNSDSDGQTDEATGTAQSVDDAAVDEDQPKRRRRGRRGGRRRRGKRNDEDNQQIETNTNEDDVAANGAASDNADDDTTTSRDDDAKPKKAARGRGRGRRVASNDGAEKERDESSQTELSRASADQVADAGADTASPTGDAAVKNRKFVGKTSGKKAAKKPAKTSVASDDDGLHDNKAVKADAKKPARGRKPKVKSQTEADGAASDDARNATNVKKPARKSSAKKAKKPTASNTEDTSVAAANGMSDADSLTTTRPPISSAPQDVIDVGTAAPDTRKRGWWSRGE